MATTEKVKTSRNPFVIQVNSYYQQALTKGTLRSRGRNPFVIQVNSYGRYQALYSQVDKS